MAATTMFTTPRPSETVYGSYRVRAAGCRYNLNLLLPPSPCATCSGVAQYPTKCQQAISSGPPTSTYAGCELVAHEVFCNATRAIRGLIIKQSTYRPFVTFVYRQLIAEANGQADKGSHVGLYLYSLEHTQHVP